MNKTLAITTIALVAGIMIIGSIAPAAFADHTANTSEEKCQKWADKADKFAAKGKSVPKGIQDKIDACDAEVEEEVPQ